RCGHRSLPRSRKWQPWNAGHGSCPAAAAESSARPAGTLLPVSRNPVVLADGLAAFRLEQPAAVRAAVAGLADAALVAERRVAVLRAQPVHAGLVLVRRVAV